MIEGFKVQVAASELQEKLRTRATWHRDRAKIQDEKRVALEQVTAKTRELLAAQGVDDDEASGLLVTGGTTAGYGKQMVHHRARAAYLEWLASHVVAGETYQLDEEELFRFEIIERLW